MVKLDVVWLEESIGTIRIDVRLIVEEQWLINGVYPEYRSFWGFVLISV